MKMVYDEWYGEISYGQKCAYKKYNVSPSDHDALVERFGESAHKTISDYVRTNSEENGGMFSTYSMWRDA